jgi:glutamate---cysteine ligase / carboxylate-amine ligase
LRERFTVGVEEEYHLVEPVTGALWGGAGVVRRGDRSGTLTGEVQDTMLEIGTPVAKEASELTAALRERRFQAAAAAAAEDLEIVAAGMHPFSGWRGLELSEGDRPRMLVGVYRQILRQLHICGMHVHVAVPAEFDRARLMNVVRAYAPHLLALSCSSPFYLGEDTGFASFRTIAWRGFPFAGTPPYFASAAEYERFVDLLLRSGVIPDERTIYWSVRPSPRYPTLELRMCDACPSLDDAVAIAALARGIVVGAALEELEPIGGSLSYSLQDELLAENEWVAARDGLDAILVAPEAAGGRLPLRDAIQELLAILGPTLEALGDGEALVAITTILERGTAADRMRASHAEGGGFSGVVEWLVEETRSRTGMDRRHERREERPVTNRAEDGR